MSKMSLLSFWHDSRSDILLPHPRPAILDQIERNQAVTRPLFQPLTKLHEPGS